jgi:hypothetical protein
MVSEESPDAGKAIQSQRRRLPMKGVPHYTREGKEWKGNTHKMPNGHLHTHKSHGKTSQRLFHFKELSKTAQKRAK